MKKIRYAVIGLGHIAQSAVLPAFKNAKINSELRALVSSDPTKLKTLARKYKVNLTYATDEFDECLQSGEIDAVYIATPNTEHQFYSEKAARAGIHVLCEKPLAPDVNACHSILKTVEECGIKFMVAYRLHFDPANLKAVDYAHSGRLGPLRIFNSVFSFNLKDFDNIRLRSDKAGGPLLDIGIYCINAARYLFRAEPTEVFAQAAAAAGDRRFTEVPEMISVVMRFPDERVANFICSFGAADCSLYDLVGTKGRLWLESAYEYAEKMELNVQIGHKKTREKFRVHDQFGPELIYFSDCILRNREPEPSVIEGLADIVVIEAIENSLKTGLPVAVIPEALKRIRPSLEQKIHRPPVSSPRTVHVTSPSGK